MVSKKEKQGPGKPIGGIMFGIAFMIIGILVTVVTKTNEEFLIVLIPIGALIIVIYAGQLIKHWRHKNNSHKTLTACLTILLTLSMFSAMPTHVKADTVRSWHGYMPDEDKVIDQTIVAYNHDEHGEVAISANLYEINKDWPQPGQYEFVISVAVAANSRYQMGYTTTYDSGGNILIWGEDYLSLGDNEGAWVDIGFPFLYYGAWYDRAFITSNGFIVLDERAYNDNGGMWTNPDPQSIPNTDGPNCLIAPLWRDLDPSKGGSIKYATLGFGPVETAFVVMWDHVPNKVNSNTQTFAVYLYGGMNTLAWITFDYESITNDVNTKVGLEDQTGKRGSPIASVTSDFYIKFEPMEDNFYRIDKIEVSAEKYIGGATNDENAVIHIDGYDDIRPGGINVKLESSEEGGYSSPPIFSAFTFALSTVALLSGYGFIGYIGYAASGTNLILQVVNCLSPIPRTTIEEADKRTQTASILSIADDERRPGLTWAWDVSISPLIRWRLLSTNEFHGLKINVEVTYMRPNDSKYTLTTYDLYVRLYPPGSCVGGTMCITKIQRLFPVIMTLVIISITVVAIVVYKRRNKLKKP